jgi:hypothetical protein
MAEISSKTVVVIKTADDFNRFMSGDKKPSSEEVKSSVTQLVQQGSHACVKTVFLQVYAGASTVVTKSESETKFKEEVTTKKLELQDVKPGKDWEVVSVEVIKWVGGWTSEQSEWIAVWYRSGESSSKTRHVKESKKD